MKIWILFLKETDGNLPKMPGDKLFLLRLSEKIDNVFWLNSNYLIFNTGNLIKITEVDERDRINIVDIKEIKNPRIFWNQFDKKLYILSGESLSFSTSLLP